jgi:hypothetical protein
MIMNEIEYLMSQRFIEQKASILYITRHNGPMSSKQIYALCELNKFFNYKEFENCINQMINVGQFKKIEWKTRSKEGYLLMHPHTILKEELNDNTGDRESKGV